MVDCISAGHIFDRGWFSSCEKFLPLTPTTLLLFIDIHGFLTMVWSTLHCYNTLYIHLELSGSFCATMQLNTLWIKTLSSPLLIHHPRWLSSGQLHYHALWPLSLYQYSSLLVCALLCTLCLSAPLFSSHQSHLQYLHLQWPSVYQHTVVPHYVIYHVPISKVIVALQQHLFSQALAVLNVVQKLWQVVGWLSVPLCSCINWEEIFYLYFLPLICMFCMHTLSLYT